MNEPTPLSAALEQIASGAARAHDDRAGAGTGLDVAAASSSARRSRTRYGAVTGLAAAAVVAAVALGGAALMRTDRPLPPVDSPTSTPTPTASPTSDAWPSAVTLDGAAPRCGDPMPALVAPEDEPELTVETITQDDPLVPGGVAQSDVTIHAPVGFALNADSPRLLLVRDGVVVAMEAAQSSDTGIVYSTDEGTLTRPGQLLDLVRCETQGRGAVPLDAGAYDLYVVQDVLRGDLTRLEQMERLTIVGGPFPITLEDAGTDEPADPHPPLEDLAVTTAGLGPLTVGVPVASNPGAAMITYDEDYCSQQMEEMGTEWDPALGSAGEWLAAGYDPAPEWIGGPELTTPFGVVVEDGILVQVAVLASQLRTAEGIGLGSTRAELLAAYPDLVPSSPGVLSQVWVLSGDTGDLVFETGDASYTDTTDDDVVVGVTIAAPGYGQATSWGSGMMPGNCGLT